MRVLEPLSKGAVGPFESFDGPSASEDATGRLAGCEGEVLARLECSSRKGSKRRARCMSHCAQEWVMLHGRSSSAHLGSPACPAR